MQTKSMQTKSRSLEGHHRSRMASRNMIPSRNRNARTLTADSMFAKVCRMMSNKEWVCRSRCPRNPEYIGNSVNLARLLWRPGP